MITKGDVVQVKSGSMYGHFADRVGEVLATDAAETLPIRVRFHSPPDSPDRAVGRIMIDSNEATAGFTERDLVLLDHPDGITPLILHERDPRHE